MNSPVKERKMPYKDNAREREYTREYNKKHKKERNKKWRQKRNEFVQSIKLKSSCAMCGWKEHPEVLHWHHVNRKDKKGRVVQQNSWKQLKEEMKKCILLCPNCHYWLHYQERARKGLEPCTVQIKKEQRKLGDFIFNATECL